MADGIIPGLLAGIDRAKQTAKASLGLLVSNPDEWGKQTAARYFPTEEEVKQYRAIREAGGNTWDTPYVQKLFNLTQFQGSIKPASGLLGSQSIDDIVGEVDRLKQLWSANPTQENQAAYLAARRIRDEATKNYQPPTTQPAQQVSNDYRGSHTAPNAAVYGGTLDNLGSIMPKDVYSSKGIGLYGIGDRKIDSEWFAAAYKAKGKPDAEVTIYRAVPKGVKDINKGDWVTTSKTYAQNHGERALNGEYEIISRKVKAKTLSSEGYPYEFGYNE